MGNDAIGTEGITTVLNFQERTGFVSIRRKCCFIRRVGLETHFDRRRRHERQVGGLDYFRNPVFFGMSHDPMDSPDILDIVGIGLRETSCDDDSGIRVGPDGLSDGLSRLHGGFVGDRARIDDTRAGSAISGRLVFINPLKPRLLQLLGDGL